MLNLVHLYYGKTIRYTRYSFSVPNFRFYYKVIPSQQTIDKNLRF